jgi:hypothetical protein
MKVVNLTDWHTDDIVAIVEAAKRQVTVDPAVAYIVFADTMSKPIDVKIECPSVVAIHISCNLAPDQTDIPDLAVLATGRAMNKSSFAKLCVAVAASITGCVDGDGKYHDCNSKQVYCNVTLSKARSIPKWAKDLCLRHEPHAVNQHGIGSRHRHMIPWPYVLSGKKALPVETINDALNALAARTDYEAELRIQELNRLIDNANKSRQSRHRSIKAIRRAARLPGKTAECSSNDSPTS